MFPPNTVLNGRYSIVRQIGQGGMGAVYEAIDMRLGNRVALKHTLPGAQQSVASFEREARLLAGMHHPALPVVSDYFFEAGAVFLVMQYIPGDDLGTMLTQRRSSFPLQDVIRWADTLLDVLGYIHGQSPPVVHRDIKPHNLKLTPRGEIILLDFGLAKGILSGTPGTAAGQSVVAYTPHYAPLEQFQGMRVEPRSDLYSLSATLYHLLTNTLPPTALERAAAQIQRQPDPLRRPSALNPSIPAGIEAVLLRGLALNVDERYATAAAMRAAWHSAAQAAAPPFMSPAPPPAYPAQPFSYSGTQPKGLYAASSGDAPPLSPPVHTPLGTPAIEETVAVAPPRPNPPAPPIVRAAPAPPTVALRPAAPAPAVVPATPGTTPVPQLTGWRLWMQWTIANTLAAWVLFLIGATAGPGSLLIFGLVLGGAQWLILRRLVTGFRVRRWLFVNSLSVPLAVLLGFAASLSINHTLTGNMFGGTIGGALIGTAQWSVLRNHFPRASLWILGCVLGWLIEVYLFNVSPGFLLLTGTVTGMVSGAVLTRLVRTAQHTGAQP